MQTFRIETIVAKNRALTLRGLPFRSGEKVEVIIISRSVRATEIQPYSLRGKPVQYESPFEPIEPDDWDATA